MENDPNDPQSVFVMPGEAHFAQQPAILKTILGSCVGITFWNRRTGVGALCHGVLPKHPDTGADHYRYVDSAIRGVLTQLENLGIRRSEIDVKVFGGADVISNLGHTRGQATVGRQNWETALDVLQNEDLRVTAKDIGGATGRALRFHTGSGAVFIRRISRMPDIDEPPGDKA